MGILRKCCFTCLSSHPQFLCPAKRLKSIKTPTHLLIGYVFSKMLPGPSRQKSTWIAVGACAPDLPLIIVAVYCWLAAGSPLTLTSGLSGFVDRVDQFYFQNKLFIAIHHLLHAPGSLALLAGLCFVYCTVTGRPVARASWFLTGAATHSIVDIFTHARDGILILWPFNWSYRFDAGVNQWDLRGTGASVLTVEIALFLTCGASVAIVRLRPFYSFLTLPMDGTLKKPAWT